MKVVLIIVIIVVVVIVAAILAMAVFFKGSDLKAYAALKEPRINTLPDRKVIEVTVKGAPESALKPAFSLMMQTYFKAKGTNKGPGMSAPLLRCAVPDESTTFDSKAFETNADWVGRVAIPVPDSVTELPAVANKAGLDMRLTTWPYGIVAEILHIGAYADETPTINRLVEYIKAQGYRITGEHEEEYLRGPESLFTKPQDYYTIIRYRIEKAGA